MSANLLSMYSGFTFLNITGEALSENQCSGELQIMAFLFLHSLSCHWVYNERTMAQIKKQDLKETFYYPQTILVQNHTFDTQS